MIDDHVALTIDRETPLGRDLLSRIVRTGDVLFDQIAVDGAGESVLELDAFQRANPGLVIVTCTESQQRASDTHGIQLSSRNADTAVPAIEAALAALWNRDRRNGEGIRLRVDAAPRYDQGEELADGAEVNADRRRANGLAVLRAVDYSEKEIEDLVGAGVLAIGRGN
ncbi:hypothetical protein [Paraburkholderia silvatlantica]|nr:hypothetical protein [Paraburkholderia silvatlantica]